MADFEDDLLALAGDESEGEEQELRSNAPLSNTSSPAPARSPTPANSPPRQSTEDYPTKTPARRAGASKGMAAKGTTKRRQAEESEEEEGEASSAVSSPQSLGSGAMSESDSDTSPNDLDDVASDDNLYPLEGKFKDSKDKAHILGMTQLEREEILAEREEEQARKKREMQLHSLLQNKDREAEKAQRKRKAGAADLDDTQHKSSRPKTKRNEALDAYTRQREQTREEKNRRERNRANRTRLTRSPTASSRASSNRDADGESEEDYSRSKVRAPEPEAPAELADMNRIHAGRMNFASYCFNPRFEDAIVGCYARVNVGPDKEKGPGAPMVHRLCEIKGLVAGKPYFMDHGSKSFFTDQYVLLALGKQEKDYPFTHCSQSKFTDDEFRRYKVVQNAEGLPIPSQSECNKRADKLSAMIAHKWSNDEINAKVAKQQKYDHMMVRKAAAVKQSAHNDRQEKLRIRNEMNRKQNAEDVRNAQIAEKNRLKTLTKQKQEAAKLLAVPNSDMDGLFSEGSDISRTGTPVPKTYIRTAEKKSAFGFTQLANDDEIIGSIDLGIDIDIDM